MTRSTNPARITTFKPGETITVRWTETIGHPGHFRIAFLQNGSAFSDPTSFTDIQANPVLPVLKDGIADLDQAGMQYMTQITLPQIECNNCTLQVIQVMTDKPPFSPSPPAGTGDDIYHQCADLVLSYGDGGTPTFDAGRDGSAGAGGAGGASDGGRGGSTGMGGGGGAGPAGTGGSNPTGGSGGAGGEGGSTPTGGSSGSTTASGTSGPGGSGAGGASTTGGGNAGEPGGKDNGCSCRLTSSGGTPPAGASGVFLLLALFVQRRRRHVPLG